MNLGKRNARRFRKYSGNPMYERSGESFPHSKKRRKSEAVTAEVDFEGNRLSLHLKMTQDSICCGATINYQDFCSECGEHTGAIQFEDAAGEPVTQYVNADGFLQDEYEPNFNGFISTVTAKEIATVGLVVLMIATIWIAT